MEQRIEKHTQVEVYELPGCDLCDETASYDAKTRQGPWGYLCEAHFAEQGVGLGLGLGQRLVAVQE